MTDRDIHDAFARMKPDEAAKERMLKNILSAVPDAQPKKRRKRAGLKRSLLLAAAVAAGLSVAAAAYGTDFFGLWSVGIPDREIYSPVQTEEGVYEPATEVVDMVSMQGLRGSPEYMAALEWEDFLAGYDPDGKILEKEDKNEEFWYGDYEAYLCYSREMADKLDEICEKYSLSLLGPLEIIYTLDELCGGVGIGNVCGGFVENGENSFYWGYYFAGGAFFYEGSLEYADGRITDYQFNCAAKGYLSTLLLNVGNLDNYEQWEYTTDNGVPLLLAVGPSKGLIFADTENSFVTVNVLGDIVAGEFTMGRQDMEDLAEAFDFSVIS